MKLIVVSIFIIFKWFSCTNTDKENNNGTKEKADSLSFISLEKNYYKSQDISDLIAYLKKIDTMLAKDSNILTYNNVGLATTKLSLLNFNNSDSVNFFLMDSLYKKILHFYRDMAVAQPNNPRVYMDIAQMYNSPQASKPDSAYIYYEKASLLCDSILKDTPTEENIYRLKISIMFLLDKDKEAKDMIARDKISLKNNKKFLKFLQDISKELEFYTRKL